MKNTVLHELHAAAGAQLLPAGEPCPLLTYGDVPSEYRAAQEHCALFDETDRGLVRVSGEERMEFLHRLLANDVRALAPGQGNRTLLLTPKGKVRFDSELDGFYRNPSQNPLLNGDWRSPSRLYVKFRDNGDPDDKDIVVTRFNRGLSIVEQSHLSPSGQ